VSTVGEVVTRARDLHPAFTVAQTPDAVAFRLLAGELRTLHRLAVQAHRAAFIVTTSYPWDPAVLTDAGLTIGPSLFVDVVRARFTDGWTTPLVRLEREPAQAPPYGGRCVRLVGTELETLQAYPQAAEAWVGIAALDVDAVPALPPVTGLASPITLPFADDALVAMLAARMGRRGSMVAGLPAIPTRDLDAEGAAAARLYLEHLAQQRRSASFQRTEGL
jgi:hypothetical protein